ncbi:MAG: TIGR02234 family membrane protein [Corynebacterium sp.]|nr:TIGR02234 family membrane protein [Corynebacterium sp.]
MGRRVGTLLIGLAAIGLWFSSRMTWVSADIVDELAGEQTAQLHGSFWSLELMGLTLVLGAATIAGLALRRRARQLIGGIALVVGAAAGWSPLELLVAGAENARAQELLRHADANSNAVLNLSISSWAQVAGTHVHAVGPIVGVLASAVAVFGGVLLLVQPGTDKPRSHKYETTAFRNDELTQDLDDSPESGRIMWDALDADIDPTDLSEGKS